MKKLQALILGPMLLFWSIVAAPLAPSADPVEATGVRTGLAIHLGTTDGQFEADLAAGGKLLVHGIALDDTSLSRARTAIQNKGLYGLASVARRDLLAKLPYGDNLVNLLVADLDALTKRGCKPPEEILAG